MDEVKCGDCKFWGKPNNLEDTGDFRECQGILHDKDKVTTASTFEDEDAKLLRSENKAVTVDGSGYFAALRTREDFGCVSFSKKEQIQ